ncbi:hypothetical protein [Glutamicibacter sp. AOP33-2CA-4]|uniref:hypothetical protein n=1 Tax=Glutamicibacter sp. AOP33-2CA-4 TaxID=3457690 RepID=UPI004034A8E7
MFWFILVLLLVAASFFIGFRIGRRNHTVNSGAKQQAWQEGYNAATNYAARTAQQPPAMPSHTQQPSTHALPPPSQEATNWPLGAPVANPAAQVYARPPVQAPAAPVRPVKQLTPRERELRNINVTLYVAALLIVAAGALFLSFALPPLPKLIALFALAAAFYGGGLYVHGAKQNLKPAASAFAGTGLALLPLSGIATYLTLPVPAAVVWLVFSVLGTLAVGFATLRLRSRVLAWIAVFVVVSTTMACAATVQRGILFYLLFLLLLSLVLLVLAVRSAKVRSSLFYSAVSATAQLLPLLVLGLALVMLTTLHARDLVWVFFLVTAHLLLSIRLLVRFRLHRLYAARVSFMLLIFATANYLAWEPRITWVLIAVLWAAQALAITHYAQGYRRLFTVPANWWRAERVLLWVLVCASMLAVMLNASGELIPWWYAVLLIPGLQLFAVPALGKRGKIEAAAIVALVLLGITASDWFAWRALPGVAVALVGLTLAMRSETDRRWHLALDQTRWIGFLVFGGFAGRTVQQMLSGFDHQTGRSSWYAMNVSENGSLQLAWVVGLWVPLFALWLFSTLQGARLAERTRGQLIRFGASALLALITLGYIGSMVNQVAGVDAATASFLGLPAGNWFFIGILLTLASVILAGWRNDGFGQERAVQILRTMVLAASGGLFLLSFQEPQNALPFVGLVNLFFYLRGAHLVHSPRWKMSYAGAAQITFTLSIWWFVDMMNFDSHGRFALLLVSVMVPQLLRLFLVMRTGRRLSREMLWITVGLVCLLPLVLVIGDVSFGLHDRGTMLLGLSLWIIHSVAGYLGIRGQSKHAEFLLFAAIMGLCGLCYVQGVQSFSATGWIHGPWWSVQMIQILLMALALISLGIQWRLRDSATLRFAPIFGTVFALFCIGLAAPAPGWFALIFLIAALQLGLLVHTRKIPWLAAGASLALLGAIGQGIEFWRGTRPSGLQSWMDPTWQLLFTAMVLLIISLLHGRFAEPVPHFPRELVTSRGASGAAARIYFAAMILSTLIAGALVHFNDLRAVWIIAGAVLIFGAAALVRMYELPTRWLRWGSDALIVLSALLGFSSYSQIIRLPDISFFFLYFTLVAGILAVHHFMGKRSPVAHGYLVAAAVLASLTQLSTLADGNGTAQVFSLFFFAALIVLGLKLGQKRYIWWGAIAITAAVLWFLRYLAFLWLVLAGIALIVAAVLKLVRVERKPKSEEADPRGAERERQDRGDAGS